VGTDIIQLLTFAEVDTTIHQPEIDYISRGRWKRETPSSDG